MASAIELALSKNHEQPNFEEYTHNISDSVALRVYSTTKPCNLKIANLQKGLIFVYKGVERIGEGTGFGFPVLIYPKETFFSSSAELEVTQTSGTLKIRKEFHMDRIARNKLGNVHLENRQARAFIKSLTDFYQRNKRFRYLRLKEFIVNMGVECAFVETDSAGKLPVTYEITGCVINVKVDFRHLRKKNPMKIFILNEQSAHFFRKYVDSQNASSVDGKIGAWDTVNADSACLTDHEGRIGFRLRNINDSILRRGREIMKSCLDWAGLDYEVNPRAEDFEYKIEIVGVEP